MSRLLVFSLSSSYHQRRHVLDADGMLGLSSFLVFGCAEPSKEKAFSTTTPEFPRLLGYTHVQPRREIFAWAGR